MDAMDQEVSKIRAEIQLLPEIEETLASLSKTLKRLSTQAEKQQIMLTTIAVDVAREQKAPMGKRENSGGQNVVGVATTRFGTSETVVQLTSETNEIHDISETSEIVN